MSDTYVTLADGRRIGPLRNYPVYIGTDARCAVRLPMGGPVKPVHAHLTAGASGMWTIGPGEPGAALFLVEGENRVRRLTSSTGLRSGDRVLLGGTSGPAITVDDGQPVSAPVATAASGGVGAGALPANSPSAPPTPASRNRMPTGDAIAAELARRAEVEAMRNSNVQAVSRFWYRWKSGTLMRPDVLVGAALSLIGALCAGCGGGSASLWYYLQKLAH